MDKREIERISREATRSRHDKLARIDLDLVRHKANDARRAARGREIHIFHEGDPDPLQRKLNALQPGTYIRPHRHLHPPKSESLILLQGLLGFVSFTEDGLPEQDRMILLDADRCVYGCDIRPGVWHTILALAPDTVIFEVKPGPYDPSADKDFATWSPAEYSAEASAFLAELEDGFRRLWGLPPRPWQPPADGQTPASGRG